MGLSLDGLRRIRQALASKAAGNEVAASTWICDQLQVAVLSTCENVKLPMLLNDMTPKDMYKLVSSLPNTLSKD